MKKELFTILFCISLLMTSCGNVNKSELTYDNVDSMAVRLAEQVNGQVAYDTNFLEFGLLISDSIQPTKYTFYQDDFAELLNEKPQYIRDIYIYGEDGNDIIGSNDLYFWHFAITNKSPITVYEEEDFYAIMYFSYTEKMANLKNNWSIYNFNPNNNSLLTLDLIDLQSEEEGEFKKNEYLANHGLSRQFLWMNSSARFAYRIESSDKELNLIYLRLFYLMSSELEYPK